MQRETDDQAARARYADRSRSRGGRRRPGRPAARAPAGGRSSIPDRRARDARAPRRAAAGERGGRGGASGCRSVVAHPAAGARGRAAHRAGRRRSRPRSGRAFAVLPPGLRACLGRSPGSARQSVSQPRLRTLVVALGVERRASSSAALTTRSTGHRIRPSACSSSPTRFAIGPLRRAGVAVEHVPGPRRAPGGAGGRRLRVLPAPPVGADPRPSATPSARPRGWRGPRRPAGGGHRPPPPPR